MKKITILITLLMLSALVTACGGTDPMDPDSISIDMQSLQDEWHVTLVPDTPYDASQPPGPMGLPEHIQINFGIADPANVQYGDPIIYIIPVEEYKQLWDEADNSSASSSLNNLESILKDRPDLNETSLSVLPYEAYVSIGAGNLAITAQKEYLDTPWGSAVRFMAAPMQGIDVILNRNMVYIEQGLTDDGKYLVSFFYPPVSTAALPNAVEEIAEEEFQKANSEWAVYRQEQEDMLNGLSSSDWEPELTTLDAVISSLQFGDYGQ